MKNQACERWKTVYSTLRILKWLSGVILPCWKRIKKNERNKGYSADLSGN
jgi:hypothetical protein